MIRKRFGRGGVVRRQALAALASLSEGEGGEEM
jgi:hypothetical protein